MPFTAHLGLSTDGCRGMGESAPTGQLGAFHGAPSGRVKASSPTGRRLSGDGPERGLQGLCGGGLASRLGVSAVGKRPMYHELLRLGRLS
eukprot:12238967-Alexandrium_andersonii.AAC.1